MSIQKKSLLSSLNATKKAIVATSTTEANPSVNARIVPRKNARIVARAAARITPRIKAQVKSRLKARTRAL